MKRRSLRIRTKLFLMLSAVGVVTMLGSIYGSYRSWISVQHFREAVNQDETALRNLLELKSAVSRVEAKAMSLELASADASVTEGTTAAQKKYELLSAVEQVERWVHNYSEDQEDGLGTVWEVATNTNQVVVRALDLAQLRERGGSAGERANEEALLEQAQENLRQALELATAREDEELAETLRTAGDASRVALLAQLIATVVAGLTGIVIAGAIAGSVVGPIDGLRDAAVAIARGEISRRAPKRGNDEVGELTDAFNALASWLQDEIARRSAEETKLRLLLETSPVGVTTVGADRRVILANAALERMLEFGCGELSGRDVSSILPTFPIDGEAGTALHALAITQNGVEVPIEVSFTPVVLPDGRVTMVTVADLRERQRVEGRLRQAEKLSAVGQLAAGVAHEINNPLTVILGFAQGVMRRLPADDGHRNPIAAIVRETTRCKELVRSLLTFSRAAGKESNPVDVNAAVDIAADLLAGHARLRSGEIQKDLDPGLPPIVANQSEIEQVLVNLLKNALDALADPGTVTVRTRPATLDGRRAVEISVVDNGTGMSEQTRARLFEPFFTTKEVGRGTGLGLSLALEMVARHKGTIEVESKLGEGSTFRVQLLAA
jgi:PAS domain S-box-containing protein